MYERYTERARRVLFFARYEAKGLGSTSIEPIHILIGIIRDDKDLIESFLPAGTVREDVFMLVMKAATNSNRIVSDVINLPLSERSKLVLRNAADIAEEAQANHIGTIHQLIAVLELPDGLSPEVVAILNQSGITKEAARGKLPEHKIISCSPSIDRLNYLQALLFRKLADALPTQLVRLPSDLLKEMVSKGECTQQEADKIAASL